MSSFDPIPIRCDSEAVTVRNAWAARIRCDLGMDHEGPHFGKLVNATYTWYDDEKDKPVQGYRRDNHARCTANTTRSHGGEGQLLRCKLHAGHKGHHISNLAYRTIRWLGPV